MAAVIEVEALHKSYRAAAGRAGAGARRARPVGAGRRRVRVPRARTGRARRPRSAACSGWPARAPVGAGCSGPSARPPARRDRPGRRAGRDAGLNPGLSGRQTLTILATTAGHRPRARSRRRSSGSAWPNAATTSCAATRSACASGSVSRSRCSRTPSCSSSTSRPTDSTPPGSARCASWSGASAPRVAPCSCPATCSARSSRCATRSPSSPAAAPSPRVPSPRSWPAPGRRRCGSRSPTSPAAPTPCDGPGSTRSADGDRIRVDVAADQAECDHPRPRRRRPLPDRAAPGRDQPRGRVLRPHRRAAAEAVDDAGCSSPSCAGSRPGGSCGSPWSSPSSASRSAASPRSRSSGSLSEAGLPAARRRGRGARRRPQEAQIEACLRRHGVDPRRRDLRRGRRGVLPGRGLRRVDDPRFHRNRLEGVLQGVSGALAVVGWALGASLVGAEFASRSMTTLLTWEPRRGRVFVAKAVAAVAADDAARARSCSSLVVAGHVARARAPRRAAAAERPHAGVARRHDRDGARAHRDRRRPSASRSPRSAATPPPPSAPASPTSSCSRTSSAARSSAGGDGCCWATSSCSSPATTTAATSPAARVTAAGVFLAAVAVTLLASAAGAFYRRDVA